ncbi:MAG TPA: sigma factor-like helix-turn-helix DNA-binding protein, partial [Solirubrobacterales bacterium]|nr:sigma factor-like helix-turn-helix DNA-binding protein [Solirubrobacterales bacterium]
QFGLTVEQIRSHTARLAAGDVSLDEHAGEESDATRGELLPDMGETPDELAWRSQRDTAVRGIIGRLWERLDERERAVIRAHYGLGQTPQTLDAIGSTFGLTAERARQIEAGALKKLRDALASWPAVRVARQVTVEAAR